MCALTLRGKKDALKNIQANSRKCLQVRSSCNETRIRRPFFASFQHTRPSAALASPASVLSGLAVDVVNDENGHWVLLEP